MAGVWLGLAGLGAEEESIPLLEVTHFRGGGGGVGGLGLVLVLGSFGIGREIDHGFAGEHFALVLAGGDFLVFGGEVVFILEFEGFDFEFEEGLFALAGGDFLSEGPVAGHGGNRAPGPDEAADRRNDDDNVIKNQQVVFQPVASLAELGFQVGHAARYLLMLIL